MPYKYTLLFSYLPSQAANAIGKRRSGGWSESVYHAQQLTLAQLNLPLVNLVNKRMALLPSTIALIGVRRQDLAVKGSAFIMNAFVHGALQETQDVPQMAVLIRGRAFNTPNILRTILRGVPDDMVKSGSLEPVAGYRTSLIEYLGAINNFYTITRKLTSNSAKIDSIDANGVVVLLDPLSGNTANTQVRIMRSRDANGNNVGGLLPVASRADDYNFTLRGWDGGNTRNGLVRLSEFENSTYSYGGDSISGCMLRKVGRPFFPYRGRVSTRR